MPTYEYRCDECRHQVEVFASMSDPPPAACEECGSAKLEKVLFPVAVHYKGSGFYSTDYKSGKRSDSSSASTTSSGESGSRSSGSSDSNSTSSGSGSSDSASSPAPTGD